MRRGLEHHDIAALRRMRHYPSRDQRQAERQAITGIAVGPFGNQQIIANKQARLHGFRGDVEGRDNKTAQDENEEAKLHEEKQEIDRKSVVYGKSVSVSVDLGGRRRIKKKIN